ncbi:MAG: chemotaxis protein CheA [Planctomycetota bacterium]|nr:chemotaxis protein CheA [Planctomycetota bacterium]
MSELNDLVKEFLVESSENLDRLDQEFLQLEQDPGNRELLASIFRTIHTVKGTSGFFGFERLQRVAHAGENLLAKLRDGVLELDDARSDALLRTVDAIRAILAEIERTGSEGSQEYAELIAELEALTAQPGAVVAVNRPATAILQPTPEAKPATSAISAQPRTQAQTQTVALTEQSLRVDVRVLDRLMNLVGELVLTRNQILQHLGHSQGALAAIGKRLDGITSQLQEEVMKTRMQPIEAVWGKLPRVVRDLARQLGKQVRLEMEGKETELDRSIIESIRDPLTHMVRNAIDHGIETPEQRRAAGKPAEGCLLLRAYHEGGKVTLEVRDDGRGIDPAKVRAKAVEKGLISRAQAERMSDKEAIELIFAPGFSTAEQVTNVSGRGVGMDVVRNNIEKIGGNVDVASVIGQGTTITIKIPLTLAIIPALIVACGGDRFAIPQVNLVELVRIEQDKAAAAIEDVYGAPVYRLRGRLLPIIDLAKELQIPAQERQALNIVVLQADEHQFGLIVDEVLDTGEIVVKPLDKQLKSLSVYAGATIMGDGSVALILDVYGLGTRAHAVTGDRERQKAAAAASAVEAREPLLLFQSPDDGRMAIPLSQVVRLEEMRPEQIETTGDLEVVQYRGDIIPLVRVFQVLPERRRNPRNPEAGVPSDILPVVIHSHQQRQVGLVVGRILDTVEESLKLQRPASRPGIKGCLVINGKVTEILDVEAVVRAVVPDFYKG